MYSVGWMPKWNPRLGSLSQGESKSKAVFLFISVIHTDPNPHSQFKAQSEMCDWSLWVREK